MYPLFADKEGLDCMNSRELALLEKAYSAEVEAALNGGSRLVQVRSQLAEKLVLEGYLREAQEVVGTGLLAVRSQGLELTEAGLLHVRFAPTAGLSGEGTDGLRGPRMGLGPPVAPSARILTLEQICPRCPRQKSPVGSPMSRWSRACAGPQLEVDARGRTGQTGALAQVGRSQRSAGLAGQRAGQGRWGGAFARRRVGFFGALACAAGPVLAWPGARRRPLNPRGRTPERSAVEQLFRCGAALPGRVLDEIFGGF